MKSGNRHTRLWAFLATLAIILLFSGPALAVDDGARAYWKGRDGTNVLSFQYLNLNMQASGTQQFDPSQFIYPNSDTEANVMIANYARHFTLFNRASSLAVNIVGGSVDLDVNTNFVPPGFLPPGVTPGDSLRQSATTTAAIALPDAGVVGPYRVVFGTSVTASGASDMASLNAWVTTLAQAPGAVDDGGALGTTWSVIGATTAVNVFDNTDTEPGVDTDYPIYLVDGTLFVADYTELWAATGRNLNVSETGGVPGGPTFVHTGLEAGPITSVGKELDSGNTISIGGRDPGYNPWYGTGMDWGGPFGNTALFAISGVIGGAPPPTPHHLSRLTRLLLSSFWRWRTRHWLVLAPGSLLPIG